MAGADFYSELGSEVVSAPAPAAPPAAAAPAETPDFYSELGTEAAPTSTLGRKAGVVGSQFAGAVLENAPVLPGMVLGAKGGAAVGAFAGPPGALVGGVLGGLSGLVAGAFAGSEARRGAQALFPGAVGGKVEDLPAVDRPLGHFGESLGGSVGAVLPTMGMAAAGLRVAPVNWVSRQFQAVLDTARRQPLIFSAVEGAGAAAAATAAFAAEALFPGRAEIRIPAEIAAGIAFPPMKHVVSASGIIGRNVKKAFSGAANMAPESVVALIPGLEAAQRHKATVVLTAFLEREEVDIPALVNRLRQPDLLGVHLNLPAGTKSGERSLLDLQAKFAESDPQFARFLKEGGEEAIQTMADLVGLLRSTGDPNMLRAAATAHEASLNMLMDIRLETAKRTAFAAVKDISTDTRAVRETLSVEMLEAVGRAQDDARAVERSLWEAVPRDIMVDDAPFRETAAQLRGVLRGSQFDLPPAVRQFIDQNLDDLGEDAASGKVSVAAVLEFRSAMLAKARDAAAGAAPDSRAVRAYDAMADAALRALDGPSLEAGRVVVVDPRGMSPEELATRAEGVAAPEGFKEAVDTARAFSRALHDTYTRSFVGAFNKRTHDGGFARSPESMVRHALAVGEDATRRNMDDIVQAMEFVRSRSEIADARGVVPTVRSLDEVEADVALVLDAQTRAFRQAAHEMLDKDGLPDPNRLASFMKKYEAVFNREDMKEVKFVINKALRSRESYLRIVGRADEAEKLRKKNSALRTIMGTELPEKAISDILNGNFPAAQLQQVFDFAAVQGGQAKTEVVNAVFDYAVTSATRGTGRELDLGALRAALYEPRSPNQKSLVGMLKDAKMAPDAYFQQLDGFFAKVSEITTNMARGVGIDLQDDPSAATDMAIRMLGVRVGSMVHDMMGGSGAGGLVAAQRGSAFARRAFETLPQGRVRGFIVDMLKDPEKMAAVLAVPQTQAQAIKQARQIHGYVLQAMAEAGDLTLEAILNRPAPDGAAPEASR